LTITVKIRSADRKYLLADRVKINPELVHERGAQRAYQNFSTVGGEVLEQLAKTEVRKVLN